MSQKFKFKSGTCFRQAFFFAVLLFPCLQAFSVTVTEVTWQSRKNFKIETKNGTYYWESPQDRSGFMSMVDATGWDWVQSGYGLMAISYRGWPNSLDRWGHPSENNGSTNKIIGEMTGDHIILESEKPNSVKARIHFFDSHVAIEYLFIKSGAKHAAIFEGVPGGSVNAKSFVLPDGTEKAVMPWCGNIDWPEDKGGEWFYLIPKPSSNPASKVRLWFGHSPATNIEGEAYSGDGTNGTPGMDVFSFGRTCTGTSGPWVEHHTGMEHKFMSGFINDDKMTHAQIQTMIRSIMANPFNPYSPTVSVQKVTSQERNDVLLESIGLGYRIVTAKPGFSLEIRNLSGKLVQTFTNERMPVWNTQNVSPGIYLLQVKGQSLQSSVGVTPIRIVVD